MRTRTTSLGGLAVLLGVCFSSSLALGQYVPTYIDVNSLWRPEQSSGYLEYQQNPIVGRFGDEYTGWIDVRNPARQMGAPNDTTYGFDMSDHSINVRTTTLTDSTGAAAAPNQVRDFDYANRVYVAQAGLSLIQSAQRAYTSGGAVAGGNPVNFTFPATPNSPNFDLDVGNKNNNLTGGPASKTVDIYYTTTNNNTAGSSLRGYMYFSGVNTNGPTLPNPGDFRPFGVVGTTGKDTAVADTFAHELGHFLLNGPSVDNPAAGDTAHSATNTNLMASGNIRWFPGQAAGNISTGPNVPPSAITQSINVVGRTAALNADGTPIVGGIDQLTAGTTATSQVARIFDSVNNAPTNNYLNLNRNAGAANRVDFDFAADVGKSNGDKTALDVNNLDGVPGADNFPGAGGERLYFGIKPTGTTVAPSDQTGKDKTGLGNFATQFPSVTDYTSNTFKFVDVFSLATRYADSDVNNKAVSPRDEALDYKVRFRDAGGNESLGLPTLVFDPGWSAATSVDDFVTRWVPTDPNFVPVGLFVDSLEGTYGNSVYDLNTQIDAVIVGVPEPATILPLLVFTTAPLLTRRRRRRP
jgi:hypothetical protein